MRFKPLFVLLLLIVLVTPSYALFEKKFFTTTLLVQGTNGTGGGGGVTTGAGKAGGVPALYNDSDTIYLNESWLDGSVNNSIAAKVTQSFLQNLLDIVYVQISYLISNYYNKTEADGLYAKYQFGSNDFNGSGDFTTSGEVNATSTNTDALTIGSVEIWVKSGDTINGTINSIKDASVSKPYLVRVPPGIYDEFQVIMKDYVSLKGSGYPMTTIKGNTNIINGGIIVPANNVSISDLSIKNSGSGDSVGIGDYSYSDLDGIVFYVNRVHMDVNYDFIRIDQSNVTYYASDITGITHFDGFTFFGENGKAVIDGCDLKFEVTDHVIGGMFVATNLSDITVKNCLIGGYSTYGTPSNSVLRAFNGTIRAYDVHVNVTSATIIYGVLVNAANSMVELYGGSIDTNGSSGSYDLRRTSGVLNVFGTKYGNSSGTITGNMKYPANITVGEAVIADKFCNSTECHTITEFLNQSTEGTISTEFNWDGLVGYWTADGHARDISGLNNDGVMSDNDTYLNAVSGKGFGLDGFNDIVTVSHDNSVSKFSNMTISAWIYSRDVNNLYPTVFGKGPGNAYAFVVSQSNRKLNFWGTIGGTPYDKLSVNAVPLEEWAHVSLIYNGSWVSFYINGVDAGGTFNATGEIAEQSGNDLLIGNVPGRSYFFNGTIDEAMIFNRSLSIDEIQSLYLIQKKGSPEATNDLMAGTVFFDENKTINISFDGNYLRADYGTGGNKVFRFSGNTSAIAHYTRTSVYDKAKGKALDKILDASDYVSKGKIDHKKFYGYVSYNITDFDRPEIEFFECLDKSKKPTVCNKTVYPYQITQEEVSMNKEIDLLRQAVYELKVELCLYRSYGWC